MSKKLSRDDLIAEIEWLLDGGMSPIYISCVLDRKPGALAKALYRAERHDLAKCFDRLVA